jgi:magnesium-protoporphyrin O-methyltransferase
MDCHCEKCEGLSQIFDEAYVEKKLAEYRRDGPKKVSRWLIAALLERGVAGKELLDIGGGLGAVQHALLEAGALSADNVDAAPDFLEAAKREGKRRGMEERIDHHFGDFLDLEDQLSEVDIVTLDKVICCYAHMEPLLRKSSANAKQWLGLVYPRSTWWVRLRHGAENIWHAITGNPFRAYPHANDDVEGLLESMGWQLDFARQDHY